MKRRYSIKFKKIGTVCASMLTLWCLCVGLVHATRDTDHKKDKTLRGSSRINPSTLAMEFSLPLGAYPGRAGNSVPLTFNYSSKVWTMRQSGYARKDHGLGVGTEGNPFIWTVMQSARAEYAERTSAGWTSSLQPVSISPESELYVQGLEGTFPTQTLGSYAGSGESAECVETSRQSLPASAECPLGGLVITYDCPADSNGSTVTVTYCYQADTGIWGTNNPGGPLQLPAIPEDTYRTKRVRLQMPDGSSHEFRKDDGIYNCNLGLCTFDWTGNYLSVDGSGMRFVAGQVIDGVTKHILYTGDGGRYIIDQLNGTQEFIDRNGNRSSYTNSTKKWLDTMGREITDPLPYSAFGGPTVGNYTNPLPALEGETRSFTQKWQKLRPDGCTDEEPICQEAGLEDLDDELYYSGNNTTENINEDGPVEPWLFTHETDHDENLVMDDGPNSIFFTVTKKYRMLSGSERFNPTVLTEVGLPNGTSYKFRYNRYGEITKIIYPTGTYERFTYGMVSSIGGGGAFPYTQPNRGVTERWVSGDGVTVTQNWKYSLTGANTSEGYRNFSLTTAPDGTKTESIVFPSGGAPYGFEDPRTGMPVEARVYSPSCQATASPITTCDSYLVGRRLTEYIVAPPRTGGHELATRDGRPSRTVSIKFEPGASSALATLGETEYDSQTDQEYFAHLNPIRQKGYRYKVLDLTAARTASLVTIAALFGSGDLASVSETDYAYDTNYKARGMVRIATETRALDPANTSIVLAKTQTVYDNALPGSNSNYSYSMLSYSGVGNSLDCAATSPAKICWQNPNGPSGSIDLSYRGLPTTSRLWDAGTSSWVETHMRYDQFGNAIASKDAIGNESTTAFSSAYKYAYPASVTAPAPDPTNTTGTDQTSTASTTYDFNTGLPLSVTDDFGQVTTTEYDDPMLRPTRVNPVVVSGSPTGPVAETEYSDGTTDATRWVKVRKQLDAVNWGEATTYVDALGRTIKTVAKDSQGDVIVETHYDTLGRVDRVTNPYRAGDTVYWNKSRYDELGRAVETYAPETLANLANAESLGVVSFGISTVTDYIGTVVTTTDASSRKGRSITNALGQLIRVDEPTAVGGTETADLGALATPAQPTSYKYDAYGKMVEVTQGAQKRWFKYDLLGRLIRVRQPEQEVNTALNLSDSYNTSGQWTAAFTYDILGNLLTTTDAKGTIVTSTYDKVSRVTTRTYSGEPQGVSTPAVSFFYDGKGLALPQSPNYAKGKLTKVTSSVSETQNTVFDNFGRMTENRQITDGNTYTSKYTYNLSGALIEEEYPTGRKVKNEFESDGDLRRIFGKANASATERTYANTFSYTTDGKIERLKLGNGLWERAAFNDRLQATELNLGHGLNGDLWKLGYEYGELDSNGSVVTAKNTGNIARMTVNFHGLSHPFIQSFKYDPLYRLTEAKETKNGTQTWIQQFGYDRYGNRNSTSQTVNGASIATTPAIDQNTNRFTSTDYLFDKNGNITRDITSTSQLRTFVFDGDNKQSEVKDANGNTVGRYLYDGEGKRVKKKVYSDGVVTEETIFVYSGGKLIAEYSTAAPPQNPTTNYTVTDLLGSPRVLTNAVGEVASRRDFLPFGEEIQTDGTHRTTTAKYSPTSDDGLRKRFTGYEKDQETGLDFAEARMYENRYARFTAVDPLIASGKSADPQTFNRYVYTLNRPLIFTDPAGLQAATNVTPCRRGPRCGEFTQTLKQEKAKVVTATGEAVVDVVIGAAQRVIDTVQSTLQDLLIPRNFAELSSSDPLQNANANRLGSVTDLTNGYDDGGLTRKILGIKGASVFGVMQQTTDSYEFARRIGEANLAFQTLYTGSITSFLPRNSPFVTTNTGISFGRQEVTFPPIKPGSAGGPTAFNRYIGADVRRQAALENPNTICVFCRQTTTAAHLDHAIPRARGGNSSILNVQVTCAFCNLSKGARAFPVNPPPGYEGPFPPPWWPQ